MRSFVFEECNDHNSHDAMVGAFSSSSKKSEKKSRVRIMRRWKR